MLEPFELSQGTSSRSTSHNRVFGAFLSEGDISPVIDRAGVPGFRLLSAARCALRRLAWICFFDCHKYKKGGLGPEGAPVRPIRG